MKKILFAMVLLFDWLSLGGGARAFEGAEPVVGS